MKKNTGYDIRRSGPVYKFCHLLLTVSERDPSAFDDSRSFNPQCLHMSPPSFYGIYILIVAYPTWLSII